MGYPLAFSYVVSFPQKDAKGSKPSCSLERLSSDRLPFLVPSQVFQVFLRNSTLAGNRLQYFKENEKVKTAMKHSEYIKKTPLVNLMCSFLDNCFDLLSIIRIENPPLASRIFSEYDTHHRISHHILGFSISYSMALTPFSSLILHRKLWLELYKQLCCRDGK